MAIHGNQHQQQDRVSGFDLMYRGLFDSPGNNPGFVPDIEAADLLRSMGPSWLTSPMPSKTRCLTQL